MQNQRTGVLLGEAIGHAAHDTWYGVAPVLLAALSNQMDLSNSDIGLVLLLYQGVSSLTQPLFGRLAEKWGGRILAVGAILWTSSLFTVVLFAQSKLLLMACIALAGLGSGAWHPQGTANSTLAGGTRWGATSTSVFFLGGTLGTSITGAALGGFLIDRFGRSALLVISVLTIATALGVVRRLVPRELHRETSTRRQAALQAREGNLGAGRLIIAFLLLGIALRALAQFSLNTYIPKFEQDRGVTPTIYGLIMSLFFASNAVGGVLGSYLGDRLGLRRILIASLALAGIGMFAFLRTDGLLGYAFLVLTGFLLGPSHTLFLVSGQRRFPQRMAMISGLLLGFTFISGAGGAWALGLISDRLGLQVALQIVPWAMIAAGGCALIAVPPADRDGVQREPAIA